MMDLATECDSCGVVLRSLSGVVVSGQVCGDVVRRLPRLAQQFAAGGDEIDLIVRGRQRADLVKTVARDRAKAAPLESAAESCGNRD